MKSRVNGHVQLIQIPQWVKARKRVAADVNSRLFHGTINFQPHHAPRRTAATAPMFFGNRLVEGGSRHQPHTLTCSCEVRTLKTMKSELKTRKLEELGNAWRKADLRLNREYQRGPRWSEPQQQALIDSLLRGYDIPYLLERSCMAFEPK